MDAGRFQAAIQTWRSSPLRASSTIRNCEGLLERVSRTSTTGATSVGRGPGIAQRGFERHASQVEIAGRQRGDVAPSDRYRLSATCQRDGLARQFANRAGHIVSGPSVPRQEDQQRGEDRGALHARDHSTSRPHAPAHQTHHAAQAAASHEERNRQRDGRHQNPCNQVFHLVSPYIGLTGRPLRRRQLPAAGVPKRRSSSGVRSS